MSSGVLPDVHIHIWLVFILSFLNGNLGIRVVSDSNSVSDDFSLHFFLLFSKGGTKKEKENEN